MKGDYYRYLAEVASGDDKTGKIAMKWPLELNAAKVFAMLLFSSNSPTF